MIKSFIKRLFCKHVFFATGGIYEDNILSYGWRRSGWKRSVWKCYKCNKLQDRYILEGFI